MSHYHHLTISERESIWECVIKGITVRHIARETGRSASTISREINRNRCAQSYRSSEAQEAYEMILSKLVYTFRSRILKLSNSLQRIVE